MIPLDRWKRIKEIFYSAQDHTPAERSAFLNEVCGNDVAMREEVEALLTADAGNDNFLSTPALEFATGMLADEPSEFSAGQVVGQYKIECLLDKGGMGQIYEAHDTKLSRKIALKFISPEYATDPRRVRRFEQEARAASALNHPNVCVIHDIGVTDNGRHFIAMEFIVGSTLRHKLALRGPFKPLEALQIIIQVGDALASAHAKGIVHRDIKPENIMLRPDGFVKVVDFGLAKLTEILPEQRHVGEAGTQVLTEPHTLLGTVKYMSPEQLRETPVDERTDIWSLGVVLYEMLTGATPFEARAPNDSIALILGSQPPELSFPDEVPIRLRQIIRNTLERDCARRYQTVTKLTADLRSLKRELELNPEADFSLVSEIQPSLVTHDRKKEPRKHGSKIFTRLKSQAISTADTLFDEIRTHKRAALFAGATSVLALLFLLPSAARWIIKFVNPPSDQVSLTETPQPPIVTMKPLTDAGTSIHAAISSDGRWVAHVEEQNGKQHLVVTNVITSGSSIAVPSDGGQYLGISFSRDNNYLYFTRTAKNGDGILYQLAWPGTNPIKLKEGVDSPISFSPQGDRYAFVRHDETTTEFSLVVSNIDGTNEQIIASRKNGDKLSVKGVAWSPEGDIVLCPTGDWKKGWHMNLVAFDLKSGREQPIGDQSWYSIQQIAWHDMNSLIISATARHTSPHQLWRISYPDGAARRITSDLSDYSSVSLAGERIVTVSSYRSWRMWVGPFDNPQAMTAIFRGAGRNYGLAWTSKGNIVFSSIAQDRLNISRIDPDGSNQVQLTNDAGDNFMPASSSDGRFIVFSSNRSGFANIWRMNADDGSDPIPLTKGDGDYYPSSSPDNQWVAYDNIVESKASIWKVPLSGGEPIKVGERYRMPVFSPDSQFIVGRYHDQSGTHDCAIFPAQGGEPLRHFDIPNQEWQSVQWLPNGRELSYVKNVDGYSNIWAYDLETGVSKQLTNFNSDQIFAYTWSPDYKQIACLRGSKINNVTMISSER